MVRASLRRCRRLLVASKNESEVPSQRSYTLERQYKILTVRVMDFGGLRTVARDLCCSFGQFHR
jgi:hypothetical protein